MNIIDESIFQITLPTPFSVGSSHAYLLKGDLLTLVDAGARTKEGKEALLYQLKQLGYMPNDIEQIVLTHHHPDHTGLIEFFPGLKNIIAHKHVDLWLKRDEDFFCHYEQFFEQVFIAAGVPNTFRIFLDRLRDPLQFAGQGKLSGILKEKDHLPGHDDWEVIETTGHAQTHLSFFRKSDGMFIGGDHLLHHISSNPLLEPPYEKNKERPKPLLDYRKNLQKCLSLDIKAVLPGHGPVFTEVHELIRMRLKKQEQRAEHVLTILKNAAQTPFEICQRLFPNHYKTQLDLTMSETIGQLDYLEKRGFIRQTEVEGVWMSHAV